MMWLLCLLMYFINAFSESISIVCYFKIVQILVHKTPPFCMMSWKSGMPRHTQEDAETQYQCYIVTRQGLRYKCSLSLIIKLTLLG
ncbi:hypothetical protein HanIR_Chr11g0509151 [Helianthus annuus]|nr:hypothetical protein HanIR_Chr11g0509151 [Helianthus annuus]